MLTLCVAHCVTHCDTLSDSHRPQSKSNLLLATHVARALLHGKSVPLTDSDVTIGEPESLPTLWSDNRPNNKDNCV